MQIQRVQSNQLSFGTNVVFSQEINNMLKKRGYGYSLPFKDCLYHLKNNGVKDTMAVALKIADNRRHYVTAMRSYTDESGQVFASKESVKRPFLKNNHVASLVEMYHELKEIPVQKFYNEQYKNQAK